MPGTKHYWDSKRFLAYKNKFLKTQQCQFYAAGVCAKGADCKFAHGTKELNTTPDLKKTALCQDFKKGKCPLPSCECAYAHGEEELRKGPAFCSVQKEMDDVSSQSDSSIDEPGQSIRSKGDQILRQLASEKKSAGRGLRNAQSDQTQRLQQQPLQEVEDREDAKFAMSASQQTPSSQGFEMQLDVFLNSMHELMKANPGFASRLAPPGLQKPSTTTSAGFTSMLMREDIVEPKAKLHGSPMYVDEPMCVPLVHSGPFSGLGSEQQLVWRL